jgi:hypothetical protein
MNFLKTQLTSICVTGLVSLFASISAVNANAPAAQEWNFRVYLDDKAIGYHHFKLTQTGKQQQLTTQADFDVEFLKITVFKYRHENVEHWNNQCLSSIASTTDENGKLFRVNGAVTDKGFRLSTVEGETTLPACISTFAYWDKSFLQHDRLLNSQNGEFLKVKIDDLGEQSVKVRKTSVPATRYKLSGEDLDIELWYSRNDQWLGLQSTTSTGRLLRYVIE